jgi:hypothetical protein
MAIASTFHSQLLHFSFDEIYFIATGEERVDVSSPFTVNVEIQIMLRWAEKSFYNY